MVNKKIYTKKYWEKQPKNTTFVSRHFSEIKAIWLAFDSLFYFTTEHLILKRREKSSKYPFEKILGSGVSYIKGRC